MAESGAESEAAGLCAELVAVAQRLRDAVRHDPDALAADHGQVDAECAVANAVRLLAPEIAGHAGPASAGEARRGRMMLARDLLITVELVARAVEATPASTDAPA